MNKPRDGKAAWRLPLNIGLLALGLVCYVASLFSPFTSAGVGTVGFGMSGFLFLLWGLEMVNSEFSHGSPPTGMILLITYLGNLAVVLSFFIHLSRPLRLFVLFAAPVAAIAAVCLFLMNLGLKYPAWGSLVFCGTLCVFGVRAGLLHYGNRLWGDGDKTARHNPGVERASEP